MRGPRRSRPPDRAVFDLLPKAELHLHLEGSLRPAVLRRLAPGATGWRGIRRCRDFNGFLRAFASVCTLLTKPWHLELALRDLGTRLRRQRVLHAEVFFSPGVHARSGIDYPVVVEALERGATAVERAGGPSLLFIADGVRQWGPVAFAEMVSAVRDRPSERVVAVGLGGDESAGSVRPFVAGFRAARRAGLAAVVHSGETSSAAAMAEVVDRIAPHRIGHGIRAVDDAVFMQRLRRLRLPLDVCPTSNRRTGAVRAGSPHPLPRLLGAGVRATLATDDPGIFGITLAGEYARAARMGLSWRDLSRLAAEAARASLLPERRRRRLVRTISHHWRGRTGEPVPGR